MNSDTDTGQDKIGLSHKRSDEYPTNTTIYFGGRPREWKRYDEVGGGTNLNKLHARVIKTRAFFRDPADHSELMHNGETGPDDDPLSDGKRIEHVCAQPGGTDVDGHPPVDQFAVLLMLQNIFYLKGVIVALMFSLFFPGMRHSHFQSSDKRRPQYAVILVY
jgi:hypothetical protein